ncbi:MULTISPECIES: DUF1835 domain-containing protein [Pseudomonadaceae]|uniref:DUF1835 domain-containing protein n=1 Tax=Pseudomonadaceae TaxID=135621 RepID=UPI0010395CEF|nr:MULTISPECIES: DUF1835 domain-containing protein [Pseudomonadaceae]MBA1276213.1 DUF1835 domain-containing protein [Stutzerimonas stutzeri]MBC8648722.1 DUF1835 domain-containing protein [Pseudomonas sp. MT4]QXY92701.1 DUF1835 domain-containing protein [Pseudomonas sp. MTM4]TCD22355.1 DUF1835 domain-containing protein [Pseudomonas sp. IC_126]
MWHLTCGDLAADSVRQHLGQGNGETVRVLRDDLAVGPLADIDSLPCAERVAFWEGVWPVALTPRPDFAVGLADDAEFLAGLASQSRPVTVWHGDSASEQLMLARVAAVLEGSALPFQEVVCGTGDSRVGTRMAVSMHAPDALAALHQPRTVEPGRIAELASQWRAVVQESAAIRRWTAGRFAGEDYKAIDGELVAACHTDWMPLARAMAQVMGHCDGFFPTDLFLYWRARELMQRGVIQLSDGAEAEYSKVQVRRTAA